MEDLTGNIRSNPNTNNTWKVIESDSLDLTVECVQGARKGTIENITRVAFLETLVIPEEQ